MTTMMTTKLKFFLRLFIGANFLIFIYDLCIPHHSTSFFTPFFWLYTFVMMITELRSESKIGFEELGATFFYGLFAGAVMVVALSCFSIILAFLFLQDWHLFDSMFKLLVSAFTLLALYLSVRDYYLSIY